MKNLFDRIVEVVDEHADRYIEVIENTLLFLVFLFIFAFALHLFAVAIAERGSSVNLPGHQRYHIQEQNGARDRGGQGLDRRRFRPEPIDGKSSHKTLS